MRGMIIMTLLVTVNRISAIGKPDVEAMDRVPVPDMLTAVELISKLHYPGLHFMMKRIDDDNVDMLVTKPEGDLETCRIKVLERY